MNELNCNEVLGQWKNFGDNNPIEYGTKFVKADSEVENCFYVVEVKSPWTTGDNFYLSCGYVDLNDDWIDWKAIKDFAGFDNVCQETEDGYKVAALIEYYGIHEFNGNPLSNKFPFCENGRYNMVETEAEAIHILNDFGITFEGSEKVVKLIVNVSNESHEKYYKASDIEIIGLTVDEETFIEIDNEKIVVSESLEQLQTLLEGYDIEVITGDEEEDED